MDLLLRAVEDSWMLPKAQQLWGLAVFPIYPRPSWSPRPVRARRPAQRAVALLERGESRACVEHLGGLPRQEFPGDRRCLWHEVGPAQVPARAALQAYVEALPYPQHALGLALAVGGQLRGLDLFDQPAACQHHWPQLVRAAAADAVSAPHDPAPPRNLLDELALCEVTVLPTTGLGQELRLTGPAVAGRALVSADTLVHLSLWSL